MSERKVFTCDFCNCEFEINQLYEGPLDVMIGKTFAMNDSNFSTALVLPYKHSCKGCLDIAFEEIKIQVNKIKDIFNRNRNAVQS